MRQLVYSNGFKYDQQWLQKQTVMIVKLVSHQFVPQLDELNAKVLAVFPKFGLCSHLPHTPITKTLFEPMQLPCSH